MCRALLEGGVRVTVCYRKLVSEQVTEFMLHVFLEEQTQNFPHFSFDKHKVSTKISVWTRDLLGVSSVLHNFSCCVLSVKNSIYIFLSPRSKSEAVYHEAVLQPS